MTSSQTEYRFIPYKTIKSITNYKPPSISLVSLGILFLIILCVMFIYASMSKNEENN